MENKLRIIIRSHHNKDETAFTLEIQDLVENVDNDVNRQRFSYSLDAALLGLPSEVAKLRDKIQEVRTSTIKHLFQQTFSGASKYAPMIDILLGEENGVIQFKAVFNGREQAGPIALQGKDIYDAIQNRDFARIIMELYDRRYRLNPVDNLENPVTPAPNYDTACIKVIVYKKTMTANGDPTSEFGLVAFDLGKGTARFSSTVSLKSFDSVESVLRGCASNAVFKLGEPEELVNMSTEEFEAFAQAEGVSIKMQWTLYKDRRSQVAWQAEYPEHRKIGERHPLNSAIVDPGRYATVSNLFYNSSLEEIIRDYKNNYIVTPAEIGVIRRLL